MLVRLSPWLAIISTLGGRVRDIKKIVMDKKQKKNYLEGEGLLHED